MHGTIIWGIHNEPVKLNVCYYNSKKMIYNVQYVILYTISLFGIKHTNHEFEFATTKYLCII